MPRRWLAPGGVASGIHESWFAAGQRRWSVLLLVVAVTVSGMIPLVLAAPAHAGVGDLGFEECIADSGANGCEDPDEDSLDTAGAVAVSGDDSNVYVASIGANSVTTFARDSATGVLSQTGCVADGGANGCDDPVRDSLSAPWGVAVSADGANVYVTSSGGDAVTTFTRDPATGSLSQLGCIANGGANGCDDPAKDSMAGARGVAVSADGKNVYATGQTDNSVTTFTRDPATGGLSQAGCVANGGENGCDNPAKDSLAQATAVTVSGDGANVYVTSNSGDALTTFTRDTETGALSQLGCVANGGAHGCDDPAKDSLDSVRGVAVSPDGDHVYATSFSGQAVTTFSRDPATGALDQSGCIANGGANGCDDPAKDSLAGAFGLNISADGATVYVAGQSANSLTTFARDPATGALSQLGCVADGGANGCDDPVKDSLGGVRGVSVSADTTNVYTASTTGNSVTTFNRDVPRFSAAPDPLSFPAQRVDTRSAPGTLSVTNTGSAELTISEVSVMGPDLGQFAIDSDACTAAPVAIGGTCDVTVVFTPASSGGKSASLRFVDDALGSPHAVTIDGSGITPASPTPEPTSPIPSPTSTDPTPTISPPAPAPTPSPSPQPVTDLVVKDAVGKGTALQPGKKTRLVKAVASRSTQNLSSAKDQSWIRKVRTRCSLQGRNLTGKDKRANCRFVTRTTKKKVAVTVTPKCSVGLKVHVRILARAPGSSRTTWQRTWRVGNRPRTTCALHANG